MSKIYHVSVAERWHRVYHIRADSLAEAKEKFESNIRYVEDDTITADSPEYLEDIELAKGVPDIEWWPDDSPLP
jgi:hypothetical protein